MAKVIFISPPYIDLYGKIGKAAGKYFPLGLGYLAAYLRKYGNHQVELFEPEAQQLSYNDIAKIIKGHSPDIVCLTSATPNFPNALKIANMIRENSNAKIVLGGVHASALPKYILENYSKLIDFIAIGEGEQTLLELVAALQNHQDLSLVKGLAFKANDKIIINEPRPFIEDLDSIPFPARDLIPQNLFTPNLHNARYKKCLTIITSRGCPYNCSFCASRIVSGKRYRMHSAEYVLEEMLLLKKNYQAQQLIITDDTFTMDQARLIRICEGMINNKLDLKWFCFSQVNKADKDILALMKKAGCYSIGFGIESSSKETLKKMGKPIDPSVALATVHLANKLGLKTQAFYVLGSPGETKEQMQDTINFAKKVNSTLAFFNMLVPFPGTRDFDHFFGTTPLNDISWENFVAIGENCVLKNSKVSEKELAELISKANIYYYFDLERLFNIVRQIKTFYELSNYFKGALALIAQAIKRP